MRASVSLWSADQLDLGTAIDRLEPVVDGFHVDVMDGQFVSELLFGPDLVRAVRRRTRRVVDVHLMVADADRWLAPCIEAGADLLTVHRASCRDLAQTLAAIQARGARAGLAVGINEPLEALWEPFERVDRVLLMGTALGVKGVDIDPAIYGRIERVVGHRERSRHRPEIFVDGGLRRHTVPRIAQAGADGVTPGSLVFGQDDWAEAVRWISSLSRDGVM